MRAARKHQEASGCCHGQKHTRLSSHPAPTPTFAQKLGRHPHQCLILSETPPDTTRRASPSGFTSRGSDEVRARSSVVVVSSDLPELLGICDRIGVLSAGRLVDIFERETWSQEQIMSACFSGYLE